MQKVQPIPPSPRAEEEGGLGQVAELVRLLISFIDSFIPRIPIYGRGNPRSPARAGTSEVPGELNQVRLRRKNPTRDPRAPGPLGARAPPPCCPPNARVRDRARPAVAMATGRPSRPPPRARPATHLGPQLPAARAPPDPRPSASLPHSHRSARVAPAAHAHPRRRDHEGAPARQVPPPFT